MPPPVGHKSHNPSLWPPGLKLFILALITLNLRVHFELCATLESSEVAIEQENIGPVRKEPQPDYTRRAININILSNLNLVDIIRAYRGSESSSSIRSSDDEALKWRRQRFRISD